MLRVGILGTGSMGSTHAVGWGATPVALAGFFSLDAPRAASLTAQHGGRVYDSMEALIADVDVVDICTPTHLHHPLILACAAAGKAVICEKPLARTAAQGLEAVEACERAGVPLLVAHVVRFFPEYAAAKQIVDSGEIGQVAVVRLTRASYQPKPAPDANWFLDPTKSGGMMLDLMIHDFDYARWVAGEVISVYARGVRAKRPDAPEDYALAILRHADGAISNIEGGWAYPPPMFRTALEIAGSGGLIEHPAGVSQPLAFYPKRKPGDNAPEVGLPGSPLHESPYTAEIRHFYDVLTKGVTPRVTARDGLAALRIGLAAIRSAETGQQVRVEDIQ
ncbi:MAG: Gfo/Idh/MocA family oxidoreductase [Anaerolineae bacterium]|nr:Gfo/Idh/MocA family oxidoreductase [Anaerolineae bacterium]NUQ05812.1 Gfo/Idh/MocA family oxidoreductase [Anaerolineae bacterium]